MKKNVFSELKVAFQQVWKTLDFSLPRSVSIPVFVVVVLLFILAVTAPSLVLLGVSDLSVILTHRVLGWSVIESTLIVCLAAALIGLAASIFWRFH